MKNHILLIDATGIAYRAFHTSSPVHRESDGEPIGAALRFAEITWKLLGDAAVDHPTHGAAVFDIPGPNFRHKLYPAYKSNRDMARSLILDGQLPYMRHIAETMGLHPIDAEGFEADDVIASLAAKAAEDDDFRATIVSSDKDFSQLVIDDVVEIVDPMARTRSREAEVVKRWGVPVNRITHVQALAGDAVDGYPGIKGVGTERAAGLVRAYGSINGIFKNVDKVPYPGIKRALKAADARERVSIFQKLATLRRDVPLAEDIWELTRLKPVLKSHLDAILKALGAPAWAMQSIFHVDQVHLRLVPAGAINGVTVAGRLDAMKWWREELIAPGQKLTEVPQPGFYKRRLVLRGPEVPACIWAEPSPQDGMLFLRCEVGGKVRDPFEEWPRLAMSPIQAAEYHRLCEALRLARFDASKPLHNPRKAPDITQARHKSTNPRKAKS